MGPVMSDHSGVTDAPHPDDRRPVNVSRRAFLGGTLGALVLTVALPARPLRAQQSAAAIVPGSRIAAFLEIHPDSTVLFRSAFIEGGQGIFTAMAQIVGEELDADPASFTVVGAPPGPDYLLVGGQARFTGGSMSVRSSYDSMRQLGASARALLIAAAAARLGVPAETLTTRPGMVVHAATGQTIAYGDLAADAADLPVPESVTLRSPAEFRWIGRPVDRIDVRMKSTGQAKYAIDTVVEGMLYGAVQHSPRLGMAAAALTNETEVRAMPGVHSVHRLDGAVAVLADSWWRARQAVETLTVEWSEPTPDNPRYMPPDFSSAGRLTALAAETGASVPAEAVGDAAAAFAAATRVVEATYDVPYLAHGQLEPPSALARWNTDGTLELWIPNQAPEMFQAAAAKVAGIEPAQVIVHSPMLGGFFGRHFLYGTANPFPQAIVLARESGRPVKLLWSREEEFLRDALRPLGLARMRAALGPDGMPVAIEAVSVGEGPTERWYGRAPDKADPSAVEGLAGKAYAIPNRSISQIPLADPAVIGYWRSVGHSMNDFFYESFLDEVADAGGVDPYELRHRLLQGNPRLLTLLETVADLSGGWKRGPFSAEDGSTRARGVAMASPFGSEVATIVEVSLDGGEAVVHDVWVAIDPGSIVNPAIIEAQVASAVALGLSATLLEEVVFADGVPQARNYDSYPILPPDRMPRVHVRIVESGAPMGGIGEPGLPGVPPAVANAVAVLTGTRIRSLPLAKVDLAAAGQ